MPAPANAGVLPAGVKEINPPKALDPDRVVAIVGATLIDGRGGPPITNSVVVVRGAKIDSIRSGKSALHPHQNPKEAAGSGSLLKPVQSRSSAARQFIPKGAEVFDASGLTLLPGFIDSHFHVERSYDLPKLFLSHVVTALRDPGQWIHVYDPIKKSELPQPRCFVAGPHLDCSPPAYPADAFLVSDAAGTLGAVNRFVDEGASVIKVYFRLPLEWIGVACRAAHQRGVPVTAHLELVDADKAIRAGLDGIEHVTSFSTVLAEADDAERFRRAVAADNEARRKGRYELWSKLDLERSPRVKPLIDLLVKRKVFLSPTLAVFERREGDKGVIEVEARAFQNMLRFVGLCHRAGVAIVIGSHSSVPKAERGWAYQREMELLLECGMTPLQVIKAGTLNNARFFRVQDRLGSVECGKLADLVLVQGNPLQDSAALRRIKAVMLNGQWVAPPLPLR